MKAGLGGCAGPLLRVLTLKGYTCRFQITGVLLKLACFFTWHRNLNSIYPSCPLCMCLKSFTKHKHAHMHNCSHTNTHLLALRSGLPKLAFRQNHTCTLGNHSICLQCKCIFQGAHLNLHPVIHRRCNQDAYMFTDPKPAITTSLYCVSPKIIT